MLSDRALNRTLLTRQQLLARSTGPASEPIDRLVELQRKHRWCRTWCCGIGSTASHLKS
jgi:hypothetical protein